MEALPELFAHEVGTDPQRVTDQLVTGGLCWTMNALRWVVETGVHAVPVSREWIDELVTDLRELANVINPREVAARQDSSPRQNISYRSGRTSLRF
jgi:hypothetical protein